MVALVYHGQAVSVVARMFETSGLLQLLLCYVDICTKLMKILLLQLFICGSCVCYVDIYTKLMKILWLQLFICGSCETRKWLHIFFLTRHVSCVCGCVYELVGLHC